MKVTVIWERPHGWGGWLLLPPYLVTCLAFVPLYLPGFLALGLMPLYLWLHERTRAALWEQPMDRLKFYAWSVPATLLYLFLTPLCWYGNKLTELFSKLPFQKGL